MQPQDQQPPSPQRDWQQPANPGYQPAPPLPGTAPQSPVTQSPQPNPPSTSDDPEIKARHEASKARYPEVSLSTDEYVIEFVKRHPIGLLSIWGLVLFVSIVVVALLPFYAVNEAAISDALGFTLPSAAVMTIPMLIILGFFLLGGFIATVVYQGNRFYLTNESVIQHVRPSLLTTKSQIINLVNVEDASFEKKGILQQLLNYGTLRLSTQGQETIYRFYFVRDPQAVVNRVNEAVEVAMRNLEGDLRMHQIRE
jgi:hypothetical protein